LSLNSAHEGYDYQDLLTSYFILKEVLDGNWESIFTIDRKNTSNGVPDRFDDLVITNGSKIQRKQIKYSNDTTSKTLEKDDLANDNSYGLAIYRLFETWCDLKTPETEFRLCLAWNEPVDDKICRVLHQQNVSSSFDDHMTKVFQINLDNLWEINPVKFNRWDNFKKYTEKESIDRNIFNDFCNELLIEVNFPKAGLGFNEPNDLEKILIRQVEKLGIGQYPNDDVYILDFLVRLAKLAGKCRSGSRKISVRDVLSELRVKTNFGEIEQKFQIDQNKNVVSDSKNQAFLDQIIQNKKNLIIGEPGAGKSWFLTNFIEYLESKNILVIRHYCFTSTEDDLNEQRVLSDVFFGNLIASIIKSFPSIKIEKKNLLASNLKELNLLISKVDKPLIIIIDGLDHIERTLNLSSSLAQEKTRIISYISQIQINQNITIVLGSQPVNEILPLIDNYAFTRIDLPKWDIENIKMLMVKFNVDDISLDQCFLSNLLNDKSQGNPLYLTYILKTISAYSSISKEDIKSLPSYDFNLKSYYEYISSKLENNITSDILGCLEFSVDKLELSDLVIYSQYLTKELEILSPLLLLNSFRGGISLYHDSFRRYILERLSPLNRKIIDGQISTWLKNKGFYENAKSYRYLLNYLIKAEQYNDVVGYANNNFLNESLFNGHSESSINNNIKNFVNVAGILQDWSLFIYLNELNRTIASTNSEENHSQFLENFEDYFEAICLIHGTEKANSLLFFSGEKNFNDNVIAKAFRILQKYGYSPRWKEIDGLFDEDINLEDIKYYVYSCKNDDLKHLFLTLVEKENKEFLKQAILALIEIQKIDSIFTLYECIKSDENEVIATIINKLLQVKGITKRLEVIDHEDSKIIKLKPLIIDFNSSYIDSDKLNNFYLNVSHYAQRDIDSLIKFEKTIQSINLFYNWIKFFIRFFIIEYTIADELKEQEIVQNFHFLASDINPYKGSPRAIDFRHDNDDLIRHTIRICLGYINSKESWESVIKDLMAIPYPALSIIESNFINDKNISFIIDAYNKFQHSEDSDYSQYADYCFKKAKYYAKSNNLGRAQNELRDAIKYITSYSFRKDTTLSELIVPLSTINTIDTAVAKEHVKNLKYLSDAVMKHTEDGKGIRWLAIDWFKEFLNIDSNLATKYLIHELIKDPYFWKLDYMFVDLLQNSNSINPIILNFLYKLSPTNNRGEYLNGFLDIILLLESVDKDLARISLINLCNRSWNDLNDKAVSKFNNAQNKLGLTKSYDLNKKGDSSDKYQNSSKSNLSEILSKKICLIDSIMEKSEIEIIDYYAKMETLSDIDLNNIYFYIKESNNEQTIIKFLILLIRKRFPWGGKKHFENLYLLVNNLDLDKKISVFLLINNFVYSQDGNFYRFVHKESMKEAVKIDKNLALKELADCLTAIYPNNDYMPHSTANLIIAFEHAGIDKNIVLSMYDQGFSFIQSRLPYNNYFEWNEVDNPELSCMNDDELAIVLILSRTKHCDAEIQKEVIVAISYLIHYDKTLLIKPLKWFFNNFIKFHHLSIAGILELLLIEKEKCSELLKNIKNELSQVLNIESLYIRNVYFDLIKGI
jgi:hypothetical protein